MSKILLYHLCMYHCVPETHPLFVPTIIFILHCPLICGHIYTCVEIFIGEKFGGLESARGIGMGNEMKNCWWALNRIRDLTCERFVSTVISETWRRCLGRGF